MRRTIWLLSLAALLSCAPVPKILTMTVSPPDQQLAEEALQRGDATIEGSALIRQRGGGSVDCAGNVVFLFPATESVTRDMIRVFGGQDGYVPRGGNEGWLRDKGTLVMPPQPNRTSVCNAQGFFTFSRVRPGTWHIMTSITWLAGHDYQGGSLLTTTNVAGDETVEVVLTTR